MLHVLIVYWYEQYIAVETSRSTPISTQYFIVRQMINLSYQNNYLYSLVKIFPRSRRPKTRQDLGEMKISAAKNAPRLLARSRRDENLGGQKRAEITGEISPRWKSRRPKTRRDYWRDLAERRDYWRDLGEMKISAAKNALRLLARSRRDENLGGQKRAEITGEISARWKSRRPKTRRDYWRDLGEMKISAAKNAPRLLARSRRDENLGGQKRAEITGEILARWKSRRPKTRWDYWRDLGEMKISAAKNAPRLLARSRRDENLGGQKRAEITGEISARWKSRRPKTRRDYWRDLAEQIRAGITGEISPRWKSRRPKTRRDYWRDLGEMKISAAKNAPRLLARSRRANTRRDYWRDLAEMKISAAKNAPRLLARSRRDENLGGQKRAEITGEISARKKSRRPKTRRD